MFMSATVLRQGFRGARIMMQPTTPGEAATCHCELLLILVFLKMENGLVKVCSGDDGTLYLG